MTELFDCYYGDETCRVWGRVYRCEYDDEITLQKEVIESSRFMPVEEILANAESLRITPDSM